MGLVPSNLYMKVVPPPLRVVGRAALAAGWTAGIIATSELDEAIARRRSIGGDGEQRFDPLLKVWARGILWLVGAQITVLPGCPLPSGRARLVVANHRSALDIPLLLAFFGGSPVSRGDLEHWPLLGLGARKAGAIFVGPSGSRERSRTIRAIRTKLLQTRTVILFAEGTTYAGDEVRPFHPGGLSGCRGLDVEVIPVGLAYHPGTEYVENSFTNHVRTIAARPKTRVVMRVGDAIPIDEPFDVHGLADRARDVVQSLVNEARRDFDRGAP